MKKFITIFILIVFLQPVFANSLNNTLTKIFSFKRIGQVAPSQDGLQTAYVVKQFNQETKQWDYFLYLQSDNKSQIIFKSDHPISSPKWSDDSNHLAFLARIKNVNTLWVYHCNTHQLKPIEFANDVLSFQWSPDGKYFAFVSPNRKENSNAVLINADEEVANNRLYVISMNGGIANAVTPEQMSITPGFLLPGFDWSPDSKNIVFTYQNKPGMSDPYQSKVGFIDLDTKKFSMLPYSSSHAVDQVVYSPDGKWIAFESGISSLTEEKNLNNNPYINNQICVANAQTFKTFCLHKTLNENSLLLGWSKSSQEVYIVETFKTLGPRIYSLNLDLSKPKLISNIAGYIDLPTLTLNSKNNYFGFRYETFSSAPEAFISKTYPFSLKQISHIQANEKNIFAKEEVIHWKSKDNLEIEGLLITPVNKDKGKKYPLYVDIHGGPADTWVNRFVGGCDEHGDLFVPTSCTTQLLNLGFMIFQPNLRGSDGYGRKFRIANAGDLGGKDFADMMSGVDYLLQKKNIDTAHIVIAGWSYGGFMTAWAITQTNQFKLAIDGGGKTDMVSFAGTTDMQWIQPEYLGKYFWKDKDAYINHSAIFHVQSIQTPLLILHGQNDKRVPIGQAYEFYHALKAQGKTVKMLMSPNSGHAPTNPSIIIANTQAINAWLTK